MTHVLLATPVAGGVVTHEYLHGVLAIQRDFAERGWTLTVTTKADGLVTRSRNRFASRVVHDETITHLLMLDADVVVAPEAVARLVESGHDVCGVCVPLREVDWARVRGLLDVLPDASADDLDAFSHYFAVEFEGEGGARTPVDGFLPVRSLGSAAMLIGRDALVAMSQSNLVTAYDAHPHRAGATESGWTFFDPFVDERGVYLSEDYAFCHRWRALASQGTGNRVVADLRSTARHIGPVPIDGDIAATLAVSRRYAVAKRDAY